MKDMRNLERFLRQKNIEEALIENPTLFTSYITSDNEQEVSELFFDRVKSFLNYDNFYTDDLFDELCEWAYFSFYEAKETDARNTTDNYVLRYNSIKDLDTFIRKIYLHNIQLL